MIHDSSLNEIEDACRLLTFSKSLPGLRYSIQFCYQDSLGIRALTIQRLVAKAGFRTIQLIAECCLLVLRVSGSHVTDGLPLFQIQTAYHVEVGFAL